MEDNSEMTDTFEVLEEMDELIASLESQNDVDLNLDEGEDNNG